MQRLPNKLLFLFGKLEDDVDDALPVDRITGIIGGRFKASSLNGPNSRVAKTVTEVAGDSKHLDSATS